MHTTDAIGMDDLHPFFRSHSLDPADGVVAAFSGGVDSLAMLILLSRTVSVGQLVAVYVNHRLRPKDELDEEERLNAANCTALGVPLRIMRLEEKAVVRLAAERGNGIEDAARVLRYRALDRVRREKGFLYIATAHTADDQAETRLTRVLQGCGPQALAGIAAVDGPVIRPILDRSRTEVVSLVCSSSLAWSEDSTNAENRYLRNRIRHTLIPVVSSIFPKYREALDTMTRRISDLASIAEPLVEQAVEQAVFIDGDAVVIDHEKLIGSPRAVLDRVFFYGWNRLNSPARSRLPYRNVQRLSDLFESGWPEGKAVAVSGTTIYRRKEKLVWEIDSSPLAAGYVSLVYSSNTPLDGTMTLVAGGRPEGKVPPEERARIDGLLITGPVAVRSCRSGDEIELVEGTKKVGRLIASWHLPPQNRWRIPVLEDAVGVCAVLGASYGGRDRVAKRCLSAALAPDAGTLYSIIEAEG